MSLPIEFLCSVFEYLKDLDSIEVPAVCKQWNAAVKTVKFSSKLKKKPMSYLKIKLEP